MNTGTRSAFRNVDNAAGATVDLGGGLRKIEVFVTGGDVYALVGPLTLLGTAVPVAGAARGRYCPNGHATIISTTDARLALRCAAGVTAVAHVTEVG